MKEIASRRGLIARNKASRSGSAALYTPETFSPDNLSAYKPRQVSEAANDNFDKITTSFILGISVSGRRSSQLIAKRLIDILGAGTGLVLLFPLLLFIAGIIRLESGGSPIFRQSRIGLNGRLFNILKFRTMHADVAGRVTRIGGFLRKTSLDELPQLWNVLVADMSLVGPRPHVPGMLAAGTPYEKLATGYGCRHLMRPGLTGLAQSRGLRGSTADPAKAVERIQHDIAYIRNFSVTLDAKIIARTIANELRGGTGS